MTAQQKGERMTRIWRFYQHFDPFLVEYGLRCTVGGFFSWWWSSSSISGWQVSSWNARNPLFGSWCTRDCKHSRIGKWRGWQKWQNWGWTLKYFPCPSICHELSRLQLPFTVAVSFFWKSRSWNAACRHMSTTVLDHPTENCGSQWGNHPIDARKFNGCNQDQFFESIQDFLWFRSSEVNGQFLWRWFFALSVYPPRRAYERLKPPSWNRGNLPRVISGFLTARAEIHPWRRCDFRGWGQKLDHDISFTKCLVIDDGKEGQKPGLIM